MKSYNVAIVGATGAVGEVLLELLGERRFPVGDLYLLASERSAGSTMSFGGKRLTVIFQTFISHYSLLGAILAPNTPRRPPLRDVLSLITPHTSDERMLFHW